MFSKSVLGWVAVVLTTCLASLWAFWGGIENFHEGWYFTSLWKNLLLAFFQYWIWSITFVGLGAVSLRWPRIGATIFILAAILVPSLGIRTSAAIFIFALPLVGMGVLWWFGRPEPRKWAYRVVVGIPLLALVGFSVEPVIRISGRVDDGNYGARIIEGNGVKLMWAPQGPGWPTGGPQVRMGTWYEARDICSHLNAEGTALLDTAVNIWRLPTANEAARSLVRHGLNAGGTWDSVSHTPLYSVMPDKESPLWNVHSPVIYWWTSTELNDSVAFRVVYNGYLNTLPKKLRAGYLGFRAVRTVP
ncbi:MAG TPA: DUF1566 domain-containing protein [Bacteroidota bacterium]|nr:DUF1566 domain-containing protein [Bacteroidota bacterium]